MLTVRSVFLYLDRTYVLQKVCTHAHLGATYERVLLTLMLLNFSLMGRIRCGIRDCNFFVAISYILVILAAVLGSFPLVALMAWCCNRQCHDPRSDSVFDAVVD